MRMLVFSVFDRKVSAYLMPFFARSVGEAMRSFEDACRDVKSPFYLHADDFELFALGTFDDAAGELVPGDHKRLCGAADFGARTALAADVRLRAVD